MAAICMASDWNIPPDINKSQSISMLIDSPLPQIPDMQIDESASEEDNRLTAKLQTEEDQIL